MPASTPSRPGALNHSNNSRSSHSAQSNQVAMVSTKIIANSDPNAINIRDAMMLVKFQYEHSCVLVKLAESYQEAQNIAKQEFHQFADIGKERIGFVLVDPTSTSAKSPRKEVRISESAWLPVTHQMPTGSTIHIIIRPDPDAKGAPPQYLEVPTPELRHSPSNLSRPSSRSSTRSRQSLFSWIGSGK